MNESLLKAYLNLHAVLQNLEEVVKLDQEMAQLVKNWDLTLEFNVRNGPKAFLEFKHGGCRHGVTAHENPTVKLYFTSADHLNRMFDGKATPIPLKGFLRLGFLKREFAQLTDRLTYYLRPEMGKLEDERYLKLNALLTLQTALYAAKALATWEPTSQRIAAHIPPGELEVEVRPAGPWFHLAFDKGGISVAKGVAKRPMAKMAFKDLGVVNALLTGRLDGFLAVANGDVVLQGQLPMVDNLNLILDRVPRYLE
jgi:hypothetical protein